MKKSAAILGVLLLLLLSACRPSGEAGGGTVPPTRQPDNGPAEESVTPPPQQTPPQDTWVPEDTAPPDYLTAEELTALTLEWSQTYRDRFAGYEAIHIDHAYWFAEYAGEAMETPFTASDGLDGKATFLPADAASDPAAAAALMLGESMEQLILVDRARMEEELGQRMAAMVGENLTEAAALSAFLKNIQYVPALADDTWYCVNTADMGYILMAYNGGYRLQRMAAMTEYAATPMFRVRMDFDRAAQAYGWFYTASLPTKPYEPTDAVTPPVEEGELVYQQVDYPGLNSMLELRTYLKTLFSDEIVDTLLGLNYYVEQEGVLYAAQFAGTFALPQGPATVMRESNTRILYSREADYVYELVGDRWLFTQFPAAE